MTIINKNDYWSKHTQSQEAIDEMQIQYVGIVRAQQGTVSADNEQFYMVATSNSLHTFLIIKNWATTVIYYSGCSSPSADSTGT